MSSEDENPPLLVQQEPRLSIREAEINLDYILDKLGVKLAKKKKHQQFIIKNQGTDIEEKKKYFELIPEMRETGTSSYLQPDLDRADSVFGGTFGISTPNWQMKLTSEWAGHKKELEGPGRNSPSETELSNDIEFYKEEACAESDNYDFEMCLRNYRGYLFSSIALIDCYINRHIILFDFNGLNNANFTLLKNSINTEERIELFINQFCNFQFKDFKQSDIWRDFKKLKNLRNETTHSLSPFIGIGIREVASNLNLSINGVGSFLKKLQEGQGRTYLGFIEQVRNSPVIHFNQVTLKGNGQKIEKKMISKTKR